MPSPGDNGERMSEKAGRSLLRAAFLLFRYRSFLMSRRMPKIEKVMWMLTAAAIGAT